MIKVGQEVKDNVTGFAGIVTGRVEYLTGCAQLLIQPKVKADGDWVESRWFDETRCEVTSRNRLTVVPLPERQTGPDRAAPRR